MMEFDVKTFYEENKHMIFIQLLQLPSQVHLQVPRSQCYLSPVFQRVSSTDTQELSTEETRKKHDYFNYLLNQYIEQRECAVLTL